MDEAHTTLEKGIVVSGSYGRPVSAAFEIPHGDLRLSIHIAMKNSVADVAVGPDDGAMISVKRMSDPEGVSEALSQKAAMEKAKLPLLAAVEKAVGDNTGSRAVSIAPELRNGHPIAVVTLLLANKTMTVIREWLE